MTIIDPTDRSAQTKIEFIEYMVAHPEQRFWQSIRNFAGEAFVMVGDQEDTLEDTFHREQK